MIMGKDVGDDQTEFLQFSALLRAKAWESIKEMNRWDQFSKHFLVFLFYIFDSSPQMKISFSVIKNHPIITGLKCSSSYKDQTTMERTDTNVSPPLNETNPNDSADELIQSEANLAFGLRRNVSLLNLN
jgi:hypothetical protein